MCPLDIVPQSGPKGKCCPGKAKKDLPFSTNGPVYPCGKIPTLSGLPMASHLPQRGRRVSASCRGFTGLFHVKRCLACPKLWVERALALSGLPWASHLPQRGRRVSPSCRGVTGLFHVKRGPDWPKLWAGKRALALSGLPMASHLPQRGRRVSAPRPGFAYLFHVKHARLALSCGREIGRLPSPACLSQAISPKGEASFRALPWVYRFDSRKTEKAAKLSPRRLSCGK